MKASEAVGAVVRSGAQLGIWGTTLLALISAAPGHDMTTLITFVGSVGGNLVANILERASRNDDIDANELRELLGSPNELDAIRQLDEQLRVNFKSLEQEVRRMAASITAEQGQLAQLIAGLTVSIDSEKEVLNSAVVGLQTGQGSLQDVVNKAARDSEVRDTENTTMLREITKRLAAIQIVNQPDGTYNEFEVAIRAKIEMARDLLNSGKPVTGLKFLRQLEEPDIIAKLSDDTKFKLWTNIGAAAAWTSDVLTAAEYLTLAHNVKRDDKVAIINAASAALMSGRNDEALLLSERARIADPRSPEAMSLYIQAIVRLDRPSELDRLISDEDWILCDAQCSFQLGSYYFSIHDFRRAEIRFRATINLNAQRADAHMMLAQSLFYPIMVRFDSDVPFPGVMAIDDRNRLTEAEDELTTAMRLLADQEYEEMIILARANRGAIRAKLNKYKESMDDCNAVLTYDPRNSLALRNKAQLLLKDGKTQEAVELFDEISDANQKDGAKKALALALIRINPTKAIQLLRPQWDENKQSAESLEGASLLLWAYSESKDSTAVADLVEELRNLWPDHPESLAAIAAQLDRDGKGEEAVPLLEDALSNATGNLKHWVAWQLASLLYELGRLQEAAALYEGIVDTGRDSVDLRKYLYSLYQSGRHKLVLEISSSVRNGGQAIPVISELEAAELESIGRLLEAKDLIEQLLRNGAREHKHVTHLAQLYHRLDQDAKAIELIESISYDAIRDNPQMLFQVAKLRTALGMPYALNYAYQAQRLTKGDPDLQAQYMLLCFEQSPDEIERTAYQPETIAVNTSVILRRADKLTILTVLDEPSLDLSNGEISINSPMAKRLLGLKLNDKVSLADSPISNTEYDVAGILTKYVGASYEITEKFKSGVYSSDKFFAGDIAESDFVPRFLDQLDQLKQRGDAVHDFYKAHKFPIHTFAEEVGRPLADVWIALTQSKSASLFADISTSESIASQAQAMMEATELVIDETALYLLARTGQSRILAKHYRLLIPQHTVDKISDELDSVNRRPPPSFAMWSEGGQYHSDKITTESIADKRQLLEQALSIVTGFAEVLPADHLLTIENEIAEIVGREFAATISIALERGCPVYVDDYALQQVLKVHFDLIGVSSVSILYALKDSAQIRADELSRQLLNLFRMNFVFIPVNADFVYYLLKAEDFRISDDLRKVLASLGAPDCSDDGALGLATETLYKVWVERLLDITRQQILYAILSAITHGRNASMTCRRLSLLARRRFLLFPDRYADMMIQMHAWMIGNGIAI